MGLLFLNQSLLARSMSKWRNRKIQRRGETGKYKDGECLLVSKRDNFLVALCQENCFPHSFFSIPKIQFKTVHMVGIDYDQSEEPNWK